MHTLGQRDKTFPKPKQTRALVSEKQLDEAIDKDLKTVLTQNLFELRTFVNYELNKSVSDAAFWEFAGNPLYRMIERSTVEDCRSKEYRKKFFEKIDVLINELRPDKELFREREERKSKHVTEWFSQDVAAHAKPEKTSLKSAHQQKTNQGFKDECNRTEENGQ